jgi:hypothetical protein
MIWVRSIIRLRQSLLLLALHILRSLLLLALHIVSPISRVDLVIRCEVLRYDAHQGTRCLRPSLARYRLVWTKHLLKHASGHEHSPIGVRYLRIPASTDTDFAMVGCWHTPSLPTTIVSSSLIYRDYKFLAFAGVGLLDSNETLVALFHEKCTNADATIGSHLVEDYFTVMLPSAPPPLTTPTRCISMCSVFIALWDSEPAIDPAPLVSPFSEPVFFLHFSRDKRACSSLQWLAWRNVLRTLA